MLRKNSPLVLKCLRRSLRPIRVVASFSTDKGKQSSEYTWSELLDETKGQKSAAISNPQRDAWKTLAEKELGRALHPQV
jgi:hypothetical protein